MATATLTFLGLAYMKERQDRLFHYITAGITLVASIAYFSMASNIGWAPIRVEFFRSDPVVAGANREIFYVRYIDWVITTPLLLLDLMLTAGMPTPTILWVMLIDEVMIICGLVGALVRSSYKWGKYRWSCITRSSLTSMSAGYFVFGCVALFYIGYVLLWEARRNASLLGSEVSKTFIICGSWTFFLWCLYPVSWGLCEGGNVISPDSEAAFYGALDFCAKPVFGALLIWGHRNISLSTLGLDISKYGAAPAPGGYHYEKTQPEGPAGYNNQGVLNRGTLRNTPSNTAATAPEPTEGTDAHV